MWRCTQSAGSSVNSSGSWGHVCSIRRARECRSSIRSSSVAASSWACSARRCSSSSMSPCHLCSIQNQPNSVQLDAPLSVSSGGAVAASVAASTGSRNPHIASGVIPFRSMPRDTAMWQSHDAACMIVSFRPLRIGPALDTRPKSRWRSVSMDRSGRTPLVSYAALASSAPSLVRPPRVGSAGSL